MPKDTEKEVWNYFLSANNYAVRQI